MPVARIAVVEDEPAIRRGVADALRFADYDVAEAADGANSFNTPRWTSPRLIGPNAAAQLQTLAASLDPTAVQPRAAEASATATAADGAGGGPRTPSGPPCNAGGSSGAASGFAAGSWAALPASPLTCKPAHELRPNRLSTALWRPTVFLALQERPG
jgi:hypothetical protein